ncbi:MAG: DUF1553 domain-containing protein [Acidobacteriota bacterium]|nr:MAG: DUF1553 domain-containing protein [Acidobacteriota bacterium]
MILAAVLWGSQPRAVADGQKTGQVDFNREIRPILSDNCFTCHGPDDKQRMAGLRLDTRAGAFIKAGVIVPGDSAKSKLVKRITSKDPNVVMPPPESGHKLTEKQIALLTQWIDEGAQWHEHWAFVAPKRPESPSLKAISGARNPIDNFIFARLEREGLKPSPEADRTTLVRRLSLDLTGLPPTPADLDAFLADRSPDAYDKLVDKLLASPHYGERMALMWLDLARYADSHGYHIDSHRDMWPWRDWVIRAFNSNKPYDQFTVEQIAGDLLPNATQDQKIATGFNRNHMINFEGGAIPEEYLSEYIVDRVETTTTTWLGLTMGCARCHNHKYDPVSQKEFYRFYAFFNNVNEVGLDGRVGNARPFLSLPTEEQTRKEEELKTAVRSLEAALDDRKIKPLIEEWEKPLRAKRPASLTAGLLAHYEMDGGLVDTSGKYLHARVLRGEPSFGEGQVEKAVNLDGQTELDFGSAGRFERDRKFTLTTWLRPGIGKVGNYIFQKIEDEETRRGWELLFEETQLFDIQRWAAPLTVRLTSSWPENAIVIRTRELFYNGQWKHLAIAYDGSGRAPGLRVWLNGQPAEVEILKDSLTGKTGSDASLLLGSKETGRAFSGGVDDLRLYETVVSESEIRQLAVEYTIHTVVAVDPEKRSKDQTARIREHFLKEVAPVEMRRQYADLVRLRKEQDELKKSVLNVMVMSEMSAPRDTYLLERGDYRNRGEKVAPGVPAVLPPLPAAEKQANRLALAKWLVDPGHPLTARVAVNRFWQLFFGHGIVKTSEDFGSQGEPPVHPELLDWLATEFIRTGWDVKALQKLIVTSATYRQSSKVTPALIEKDPENRLLARGPRFRLPAELVRDNALAVSGLLEPKIGGPSVLPYQTPGLWEELAFGDGFSMQTYVQGHGEDLYRRSMYTFWKRTVPPASLSTFDAPDREKCVARRAVTNTPLQALVLMNDPTYVEAARALAQRAWLEGGRGTRDRIDFAFRRATGRHPTRQEIGVLGTLLNQQLTAFRRDPAAAAKLISVGESAASERIPKHELAAWTMVAGAILNLDETITRE